MSGTITWYRRSDPDIPSPQHGREYLFWIDDGDDGYATVHTMVMRHWPGGSTHWAEINAPDSNP